MISSYSNSIETLKCKDFDSHFNELFNLNKLRLKKQNNEMDSFPTQAAKVLFYQFLKVNKTFEKASVQQLFECAISLNALFLKVTFLKKKY